MIQEIKEKPHFQVRIMRKLWLFFDFLDHVGCKAELGWLKSRDNNRRPFRRSERRHVALSSLACRLTNLYAGTPLTKQGTYVMHHIPRLPQRANVQSLPYIIITQTSCLRLIVGLLVAEALQSVRSRSTEYKHIF